MVTVLVAALALESSGLGLTVVRRLIIDPKPDVPVSVSPSEGSSYTDGNGDVHIVLDSATSWTEMAQKWKGKCDRIVAVPPRVGGQALAAAEIDKSRRDFRLAVKEFEKVEELLGQKPSAKKISARGLNGQSIRLDYQQTRKKEFKQIEPMPTPTRAFGQWVYDGPTNMNGYEQEGFGVGFINGRANDAAFDYQNPSRLYAATGRGGIWRSDNNGVTWIPLSDTWPTMGTNVIRTNPTLAQHVYAGTGDHPTGFGAGHGIMVSTDKGQTWAQRGQTQFDDMMITDIAVSPVNPSRLIVASGGPSSKKNLLYVTNDEGLTWSSPLTTTIEWTDLEIAEPVNGIRTIYAAGKRASRDLVLYRSDDDGASFTSMSVPAAVDKDFPYITSSKVSPKRLYLHYTFSQRVWVNSGTNGAWVEITDDLITEAGSDWSQESFNYGITCVKRNTLLAPVDVLFIQNTDTYVTELASAADGTAAGDWKSFCFSYTSNDLIHVDHHGVIPHPTDPLQILFCTDGGVYRCFYENLTNEGIFTSLNANLGASLASRISVPFEPVNGALVGFQDNGMGYVGGDFGNWANVANGDLGHSAINPGFPANMYVMPANFGQGSDPNIPGYIIETSDDWQTRVERPVNTFGDKRRSSCPVAFGPMPRYVYVATNYMYRYDRQTQTWASKLGNQILDAEEHVRHFQVSPTNPNRIYTVGKTGDVYMTKDGGAGWKLISEGVSGLPNFTLSHVSIDPTNEKRVLVAVEEGGLNTKLYECLDTEADPPVWTDKHGIMGGFILPKQPIIAIARHPTKGATTWFVAGDAGVFMTADSGSTWTDMTPEGSFPNVPCTDIKIQASTSRIFVTTYGRGVWHRQLPYIFSGG